MLLYYLEVKKKKIKIWKGVHSFILIWMPCRLVELDEVMDKIQIVSAVDRTSVSDNLIKKLQNKRS